MEISIIGQGLAGCCLAWELEWAGASYTVWDEPGPLAASRVAGGLVNPVTGRNYTPATRFAETVAEAEAFYSRVSGITGRQFWFPMPVVRLLTPREWQKIQPKLDDPALAPWIVATGGPAGEWAGSITLRGGGRVATQDFCEATTDWMKAAGRFASSGGVRTVHCGGAADLVAGLCGPHRCARGEILTLEAAWPQDCIVTGGGGWVVPLGDGKFKAGATYAWDRLDCGPTAEGLETVRALVGRIMGDDFRVLDHQAGVRPIVRRSQPVAGAMPDGSVVFNGLGSKGSLYAPWAARRLADWLVTGSALPAELDAAHLHA